MRHSDAALEAIGLGELQEMHSGELWMPGELDGFTLALQSGWRYHLRKVYRHGGRSVVLLCGSVKECQDWLSHYLYFGSRGNTREQANMRKCYRCKCNVEGG